MAEYKVIDKSALEAITQLMNLRSRYTSAIDSTYAEYLNDYDRNKDILTEKALNNQREASKGYGKRKVADLYDAMQKEAEKAFQTMKSELRLWATSPADNSIIEQLKPYYEFGLKMEPEEINALVERAAGNYVTLRCIDAAARKSGYHVTFTTMADFQKDIDELESKFRALQYYAPTGSGHATDLLPERVMVNGIPQGYVSSINVAVSSSVARALSDQLREVKDRWECNVLPIVSKTAEDGETAAENAQRTTAPNIKAEPIQTDEQLAAAIAAEREKQNKRSKEILEMYGAKFKQEEPHDTPQNSEE